MHISGYIGNFSLHFYVNIEYDSVHICFINANGKMEILPR